MAAAEIKKELKLILTRLQDMDFVTAATVCDQAGTNMSAIKMLLVESRETLIKNNQEERASGLFCFVIGDGGREIVPVYDPPHLLKGVRNKLLEYIRSCS